MYDNFQLEKLRLFLNSALSDDQIISNPRLGTQGVAKVARHMKITVEEVPAIINELAEKLRTDLKEDATGTNPRFSYETDSLGGVTVRDAQSGDDKYLDIQSAAKLLTALKNGGDAEQNLLAQAMNESIERELSADEMSIPRSSMFNFPWKLNEQNGFGTAEFSGFGSQFKMNIVAVVNADGETIDIDQNHLLNEAKKFIDHV